MVRRLVLVALVMIISGAAHAAELGGVVMPDAQTVDGTRMLLNGIGLRTYSILRIPIYVAGLYLDQPSADADAILQSPQRKLLDIHFLRAVDADHARASWQKGFEQNCQKPCTLNPADVQRFLAAVPAVKKGDESMLLFTPHGARVIFDGQLMGDIANPQFAQVMLATFIGPVPPTPRLKRELLGGHDD